jgi:hypothetical protein
MAQGEYCLFEIAEDGTWSPCFDGFRRNTLLYTWGHLAAQCIGRGDRRYHIAVMYLEFENSSDTIAVPIFHPEDGVEYYDGLASSPNRDYLRVPIEASPNIMVAPGYEALLAPDLGNRIVFAAQTGSGVGIHGKPFSDGAGSKVFGIALAAAPSLADPTADILLARGYYDPADQITKTARQLAAVYRITFGDETP